MKDYATTERQAFIAVQQQQPDTHAAKLRRAKQWLGERYCLRNPSTLEYRPAEVRVPNLALVTRLD